MMIPRVIRQDPARIGLAWALLCFWPPFFGANLSGEEMFTDNLLLHWSLFAGLLLGLCAVALRHWLPGKIAHVTATAGLGGGPAYITLLTKHQLSRGKKVRIFCSDEKPYVEIWRRMGIDVSALPMRRPNVSSMWQLLKELLREPVPMHAHGRGAAFLPCASRYWCVFRSSINPTGRIMRSIADIAMCPAGASRRFAVSYSTRLSMSLPGNARWRGDSGSRSDDPE